MASFPKQYSPGGFCRVPLSWFGFQVFRNVCECSTQHACADSPAHRSGARKEDSSWSCSSAATHRPPLTRPAAPSARREVLPTLGRTSTFSPQGSLRAPPPPRTHCSQACEGKIGPNRSFIDNGSITNAPRSNIHHSVDRGERSSVAPPVDWLQHAHKLRLPEQRAPDVGPVNVRKGKTSGVKKVRHHSSSSLIHFLFLFPGVLRIHHFLSRSNETINFTPLLVLYVQ